MGTNQPNANPAYLSRLCEFTKALSISSGEIIKHHRELNDFSVHEKSTEVDFVTSADFEVDQHIINAIKENYPEHQIMTEESYKQGSDFDYDKPLWIVDPIDGTSNFMYGLPEVAVSIAYMEKFELKVGVVYLPFTAEMFWAVRGQGAYLGEKKIETKNIKLKKSLIHIGVTGERTADEVKKFFKRAENIINHCKNFRRYGASAVHLSYIACGRLHGSCETVKPWDIAAGVLILKEAGGVIANLAEPQLQNDKLYWFDKMGASLPGELFSYEFVAGAPGMIDEFLEVLKI